MDDRERLKARIAELRATRTWHGKPPGFEAVLAQLRSEGFTVGQWTVRNLIRELAATPLAAPAPAPAAPATQGTDELLALLLKRRDEGVNPQELTKFEPDAAQRLESAGYLLVFKAGKLVLERDPKLTEREGVFSGVFAEGRPWYRFMVMSDSHFGGRQAQPRFVRDVLQEAERRQCEAVLHCGDVLDGAPFMHKGFVFELALRSIDEQVDYAVQIFKESQIPVYALGGNHDGSWFKDSGIDALRLIEDRLDNFKNLGPTAAWIAGPNGDENFIRLAHPGDGTSYALSYKDQKMAEYLVLENDKVPTGFHFTGHYHKMNNMRGPNGARYFLVPASSGRTPFMKDRKLVNQSGVYFIEFTLDRLGRVDRCTVEDVPLWPAQWERCDYEDFVRYRRSAPGNVWGKR